MGSNISCTSCKSKDRKSTLGTAELQSSTTDINISEPTDVASTMDNKAEETAIQITEAECNAKFQNEFENPTADDLESTPVDIKALISKSVTLDLRKEDRNLLKRFAKSFILSAEQASTKVQPKSKMDTVVENAPGMLITGTIGILVGILPQAAPVAALVKPLADKANEAVSDAQANKRFKNHNKIQRKVKQLIRKEYGKGDESLTKTFRRFYTHMATDIFLRFKDKIHQLFVVCDQDYTLIEDIGKFAGSRFCNTWKYVTDTKEFLKEFVGEEKREGKLSYENIKNLVTARITSASKKNEIQDFEAMFTEPVPAVFVEPDVRIKGNGNEGKQKSKIKSKTKAEDMAQPLIRPPFEFEYQEMLQLQEKDKDKLKSIDFELIVSSNSTNKDAGTTGSVAWKKHQFIWEDYTLLAVDVYKELSIDEDLYPHNAHHHETRSFIEKKINPVLEKLCNVETILVNDAEKSKVWTPFCTVPAPTPNFTGREDLIATIHNQIEQCSSEREYSKKIVVIHGLGGMGKSEVVRTYVQIYIQDCQDSTIRNAAWIDAQSKNSLESSFKSLAEKLKIQHKDKEITHVVYSIYEYLADQNQPSLFIFDNAEQMRSEDNVFGIFDFLPTTQLKTIPQIIITTCFKDWEIPKENILQINELCEEAGVKFLTERWTLSSAQRQDKAIMDALKDLACSLQCFPLGLTLAASNIKLSKLRSIPKEIKDYIQKINSPHEGWILERQSAGTASKYDLIMNNVWAATLEKLRSRGDDGEAAISVLNMIAYFSPDKIQVEKVDEVAKFSGLLTSKAGIEMLELYSLISLPSPPHPSSNQRIRIHRLVQRCTRDKLDREKNYSHLLNISMYLAQETWHYLDSQTQTIHQHLKERMWPENSIHFSILFASRINTYSDKYKIVKDVHEVLVLDVKRDFAQNLADDYKILHALNLFYLSNYDNKYDDIDYKKLREDLISKDPSYSKKYLEQVFVSTIEKCVKGLFTGTMDMEDLVKRAIVHTLFKFTEDDDQPELSAQAQEEISSMLDDATDNSFEGSVQTVGQCYILLWVMCRLCKPISVSSYVKTVSKIHGSVYASIQELGESRLDSYWQDDRPIPYFDVVWVQEYDSNAEWNRDFVESFRTEAGLQFLLEHLQYVDAQFKIDFYPRNAEELFAFISVLGWKWNCTKEFVQANLFMETLYSVTKKLFEWDGHYFTFWCLLAWFGLFGNNTWEDCNGVSWSIRSVEKEMILFLDTADSAGMGLPFWNAKPELNKFIECSRSDQESIAVKTATRMLGCIYAD